MFVLNVCQPLSVLGSSHGQNVCLSRELYSLSFAQLGMWGGKQEATACKQWAPAACLCMRRTMGATQAGVQSMVDNRQAATEQRSLKQSMMR